MDHASFGLTVARGHIRAIDRASNQALIAAMKWADKVDELDVKRSALPVVVENREDASSHIAWVLAESGLIQLSIDDVAISDTRLQATALIYSLSPSQVKLAREILLGSSVVQAANNLHISVTTARTQIQRMFEKVGVRTQVSLVRALLSCAIPSASVPNLG